MAVYHYQLPRDVNGIVQGAYRLLHEDPTFNGPIGIYTLIDGASTFPAAGRMLLCAIGEYGSRLYLEPWGDLPRGFPLPELVRAEVPAETDLDACPWRVPTPAVAPVAPAPMAEVVHEASEPADSLDDMTREDLLAFAELHDIDIDRRWGDARLRAVLRSAVATD